MRSIENIPHSAGHRWFAWLQKIMLMLPSSRIRPINRRALAELDGHDGMTSLAFRKKLAAKAFFLTAAGPTEPFPNRFAFADQGERFPATLTLSSTQALNARFAGSGAQPLN